MNKNFVSFTNAIVRIIVPLILTVYLGDAPIVLKFALIIHTVTSLKCVLITFVPTPYVILVVLRRKTVQMQIHQTMTAVHMILNVLMLYVLMVLLKSVKVFVLIHLKIVKAWAYLASAMTQNVMMMIPVLIFTFARMECVFLKP